jgi:glucosamine-6-phosphate deaminase
MEIIIQPSAEQASLLVAEMLAARMRRKPQLVLGLASGNTPKRLYREMARLHAEESLDFSAVTTFNLDEYLEVPENHPGSLRFFMEENLFQRVNLDRSRIHVPDGNATNIEAACDAYEFAIRKSGGIDVQILGVGVEAHIGFNEPSSSLASRTRIKTLTDRTRRENAVSFGGLSEVPHHVVTMGIGTIMEAREIFVLAFGKKKALSIAQMVEGPVSAIVPASALQFHPKTRVFIDEEAASELKRKDYYRWVFDNKPHKERDFR